MATFFTAKPVVTIVSIVVFHRRYGAPAVSFVLIDKRSWKRVVGEASRFALGSNPANSLLMITLLKFLI